MTTTYYAQLLHACNRAGRWVTRFVGDLSFIFPRCRHTHWSLVENFASHKRECHLKMQTLRSSVNMQGPHAQRPAATRHLCRCLWFQNLTLAQRSFQHDEDRSVLLSNNGVPMFCQFVKAQARHCGGAFVCIFEKYSTSEPRCQKAKVPVSCFVVAANAKKARQTAPNAMLPILPASCFESTTRCSVFLRVEGGVASTEYSAMLAPATNGNNSALMLDAYSIRPRRHHILIMRERRWRRNDCDHHLARMAPLTRGPLYQSQAKDHRTCVPSSFECSHLSGALRRLLKQAANQSPRSADQ